MTESLKVTHLDSHEALKKELGELNHDTMLMQYFMYQGSLYTATWLFEEMQKQEVTKERLSEVISNYELNCMVVRELLKEKFGIDFDPLRPVRQ